jgi:multiple sugar transport system substrate-binding protein
MQVRWSYGIGSVVLIVACLTGLLSGCGTAEKAAGVSNTTTNGKLAEAPVTMQVFQAGAGISDTEFKELISDPVHKKYPNISLELVRQTKDVTADSLVAAGQFPDLLFVDSLNLNTFLDLNLLFDMSELAKKYNVDIHHFEKRAIDEIKRYGTQAQLYAMPFSINFGALFYNKDIFNKAGISYPHDNMSWEDVIELANKLAARDPDISGVAYDGINRMAVSLRVPFVDAQTGKARLTTEEWQSTIRLFKALNDIPDNKRVKKARNGFEVDQKAAMLVSYGARVGEMEELLKNGKSFDWDLTTFPYLKEAKSQGMETESHVLAVSSTSPNKDAAFQIAAYLTASNEVQSEVARNARISSLSDEKYKKLYGANLQSLQGKNVAAIFKNRFGPNAKASKYDPLVKTAINAALKKVISGVDVNTALREAENMANQAIDSSKQGGN